MYGVISGRYPPAHLEIFKTPIEIYASMLITASAAAAVLTKRGSGS